MGPGQDGGTSMFLGQRKAAARVAADRHVDAAQTPHNFKSTKRPCWHMMTILMSPKSRLLHFAEKYIWWQPPHQAARDQQRLIAQVMNLGDYTDVQELLGIVGEASFRQALTEAEAGQFDERSWTYWHYRLGLATRGEVPPLPKRKISDKPVQAAP